MGLSSYGLGLWWAKVGKWQVIMAFATLAAYFITKYFTGNKEVALIAAMVAVVVVVMVADLAVALIAAIVVVITAVVVSASAAALAVVWAAILIVALTVAVTVDEAANVGANKKVFWLSYVIQFVVVLFPMLI